MTGCTWKQRKNQKIYSQVLSSYFLGCRSSLVVAPGNKHPCNKRHLLLLLAFSAEKRCKWSGIPLWPPGVSCLGCVTLPKTLVLLLPSPAERGGCWTHSPEAVGTLLSSSQSTHNGELSTNYPLPPGCQCPGLKWGKWAPAQPDPVRPGWYLPPLGQSSVTHPLEKWETKIAHSRTFQQIWLQTFVEWGGPWLTARHAHPLCTWRITFLLETRRKTKARWKPKTNVYPILSSVGNCPQTSHGMNLMEGIFGDTRGLKKMLLLFYSSHPMEWT